MTESQPSGAPPPPPRQPHALLRRTLLVLGAGTALLVAGVLSLRVPAIGTAAANLVLGRLPLVPGARLSVQRAQGDWLSHLELRGLRLAGGGIRYVVADTLRVRWQPWPLLRGRIVVDSAELSGVLVDPRLFTVPRPPAARPSRRLTFEDVLRGRFYRGPHLSAGRLSLRELRGAGRDHSLLAGMADSLVRVLGVRLEARDCSLGDGFAFIVDTLAVRVRPPTGRDGSVDVRARASLAQGRLELQQLSLVSPTSDVRLHGVFAYANGGTRPDAGLSLAAAPLDLADLAAFLPAPDSGIAGFEGLLHARAELGGGSLDSVSGTFTAGLERGRIAGLSLEAVRLETPLDRGRARLRLTADVEGAPVQVEGWLRPLDEHPAYALTARSPRLPARLPGAPWWPEFARRAPFALELGVTGQGYAGMVADLKGAAHGAAGAVALDAHVDRSHGLTWEVSRLALHGLDVARLAGIDAASRIEGEVRGRGETGPRGRSRARVQLALGPSTFERWSATSASARATLDESGGGASLAIDSEGGSLRVDSLRWSSAGRSPFRLSGVRLRIEDLARFSADAKLAGRLEARAELDGTGFARLTGPQGGLAALRGGQVRSQGRLELLPSRFRGRELRGGRLEFSLARGAVEVHGTLDSDAGRVRATATSRPFDDVPAHRLEQLRFDDVDLAAWLGDDRLRSRLAGTLAAESRGPSRAGAAVRAWSARLRLDPGRVGPAGFERGEVDAQGTGPDSRLAGRLEVEGGAVALAASLHSEGARSAAGVRLEAPFSVLPALMGRDTLRASGALTLALEATGPLRDPAAMLASGRLTAHGNVERATLDTLLLDFHLARGTVTVDTLTLRSDVATARASGRVALTEPPGGGPAEKVARLHAEAELRDPSRLAPLLGADSLSVGSGSLVLDLSGPARDREFQLGADLRTLVWNDVHVKRGSAWAAGRIGADGRLLQGEARLASDWMTFGDLRVPTARLHLAGDSRRLRWDGEGTLRDRDSLWCAGGFRPDSAGWRLSLERLDLSSDSTRWRLSRTADLAVRAARVELDGFELRSAGGRLAAHGVLDRSATQDFHAEAHGIGLGVVSALGHLRGVEGAVSGSLDVTGPAREPRARGSVRATLRSRGEPAGELGADADWTAGGFDLRSAFSSPARDSIVLSGHLPIAFTLVPPEPGAPSRPRISGEHAELRLRATRFPMGSLLPLLGSAGVRALAGTLDMDLRLAGRGSEFRGAGGATIAGGRLELPGLGGKYSDLQLQAAWDGDRLVLRRFHLLAGKGRLDASGSVRIASLTRAEPDLTLQADRAVLVDTKELQMVASGDLHLGGALASPEIRGRVRFGGSHLLIASETLSDPNAKQDIPLSPEDLRTLEETFTYVEPVTPDPLLGLYDASDLDVTVVLDRNNWIRQTAEPRISAEIFGEVRMRKRPGGEPELVGRLEPLPGRGYVEQFGRSFALTGGEVLLNGPMSSHTLDLRAQYPSERDATSRQTNDVVVRLQLEGTLEKMRLVLSSEPRLSETEIITFIATGRSPTTRGGSSTSTGSDAVNLGVDMGMAMVSGALEDAAQKSVGLDVLKVGYDGIQGSTLIAGRYVAPQLYVGFRQPLQTLDTNSANSEEDVDTKIEMEYAAYRWMVLNVQGESSFIRSYLRFKHDY